MTKPYWENSRHGLRIYHGDSVELLEDVSAGVDVFVTDPFWGLGGGRGGQAREFGKAKYDGSFEDTPEAVEQIAVPVVTNCITVCERGAVTPGNRCLMLYPQPEDIGCFWQPAARSVGPWGFAVFNPILYYGRDYRRGKGALPAGTKNNSVPDVKWHPCSKPLPPWLWLVGKVSRPGETIIDPFMGAGTTLVAAYRLGRNAVGIEISEEYCEKAAMRLEEELRQGLLFPVVDEGGGEDAVQQEMAFD